MTLRVLAASGDSVGHLNHAIVVLDALAERHPVEGAVALAADSVFHGYAQRHGWPVIAAGRKEGLDRELTRADLARHAFRLVRLTARGLGDARAALDRFRPDLVVGVGGRSSFPTVLAAALRGIPCVTVPHWAVRRANWLLSLVVDRTCIVREADRARFPAFVRPRLRVTGTPLRPEAHRAVPAGEARRRLGLDPHRPVVAFVGYSRGSARYTALVSETLRLLSAGGTRAQAVFQHGEHPPAGALPDGVARPFFDDLLDVFSAADLVVSAGGETTLLEAAARGAPAVWLALPDTAIGAHIGVLGKMLHAEGAIRFHPRTPEPAALAAEVAALLADAGGRGRMAEAARAAVRPDAVQRVVAVIEELLASRGVAAAPAERPLAVPA